MSLPFLRKFYVFFVSQKFSITSNECIDIHTLNLSLYIYITRLILYTTLIHTYIHNVHIYIHIFAHSSGCVVNGSNAIYGCLLSYHITILSPSLSLARDALVLEVSEKEAREHFIHKLQEARRNAWFTSLNWYVHGLAKDNRA